MVHHSFEKGGSYEIGTIILPFILFASAGDPWHFGADPDPDPRIRTSD